ncbi:hypothetical protein IRT38_00655 (plasmid) [Acinetobacter sp. SK-43]|uniref:hypothetical protein n=1 Tax=Pseudomonadota TaxID=1224 RepID=UPI0012CCAB6E|nr:MULTISPECIES: hypothetical protein [Pseudomonadota]MBF4453925.1 hypothetical protein [Acinetobacter sp. SK-43]MPS92857.1 type I-E CRISPR-associated protein Cas6/Cse3/CasE [Comamonas sp.]
MKAFNFAFKQAGPDLHTTLFNNLKRLNNHDFDLKNENRAKLVFHSINERIMVRSAIKPSGITSIEETLDVEQGNRIKGTVTLSQIKQCYLSKDEIANFIKEKGREPNNKEIYPYLLMTGERLDQYIVTLFAKSGMNLEKFIHIENGSRYFKKTDTSFKAIDVVFEAKITDIQLFEKAWYNGIGRYKTMGFGMLRVINNEG